MAGAKFTEGINLYLKHEAQCLVNEEIMTKVTQLYTNRALAWHNLDNQTDAFADADYVLKNIDGKNTKALFRRAHAYKMKSQYSLAVQDLEVICSIDSKNPVAKKEMVELKLKIKEEGSKKIQEVDSTPAPAKTESPVKSTPAQNDSGKKPKVVNKTKLLDSEMVEQAAARASADASEQAMKSIPKTAAGFEKDFN